MRAMRTVSVVFLAAALVFFLSDDVALGAAFVALGAAFLAIDSGNQRASKDQAPR